MLRYLGILPALLLVGCATDRAVKFHVTTMDTEEKPVTCVIFANDELVLDEKSQDPLRTPVDVKVQFREKTDGPGFESVKIGVRAVEIDKDGKIVKGLREREESPYIEDARSVYPTDSRQQTFFLRKNRVQE